MAGTLTELTVAGQLLTRALGRRLRGELEPPPDLDAFRQGFQQLLDRVPADTFAEVRWFSLAANAPPWIDSGLQLGPGEEATYFICGRTGVSKAELAQRLGKSKARISQLLGGSSNMTIGTLADIAFVLGLTLEKTFREYSEGRYRNADEDPTVVIRAVHDSRAS